MAWLIQMTNHYFAIIRPLNLFIAGITQALIFFIVIRPELLSHEISPLLRDNLIFWFIFCMICLAAGGYVINDYFDIVPDRINKPMKQIAAKHISVSATLQYYIILNILGILPAVHIAFKTGTAPLLYIYPLAVFLLFLYSWKLKHLSLTGNLMVSFFCAMVPGILWFAEKDNLSLLINVSETKGIFIEISLFFYTVFAFFSTFIREIVKDMQDVPGDLLAGSHHFVIRAGSDVSRKMVMVLMMILLISIVMFVYLVVFFQNNTLTIVILAFLLMIFPLLWSAYRFYSAREPSEYKHAASDLKVLMSGGLLFLLLIHGIDKI
ncbi:MAG TPA: geranylgeranylglycerol-phosphate geranylgeranyltransferase [Saprospiraceae bacterium]|nr:geranylgeranylglycerol-phosphate geranylgeranyltransferase [Saprospiraceae bacterium]